jgi:hypothetical protein
LGLAKDESVLVSFFQIYLSGQTNSSFDNPVKLFWNLNPMLGTSENRVEVVHVGAKDGQHHIKVGAKAADTIVRLAPK